VTMNDFNRNHGKALLAVYNKSPKKLVSTVYSDYDYLPWLFAYGPRSFFFSTENVHRYIEWLINKVGVKENELMVSHFVDNGGAALMELFNDSPMKVIEYLRENPPRPIDESLPAEVNSWWVHVFSIFVSFFQSSPPSL